MAASFVYESTWRSLRQWDRKKQDEIPAYLALAERHAVAARSWAPVGAVTHYRF